MERTVFLKKEEKMDSQKGVTLLSMIIVIILIVLLASFALLSSRDLVVEGNMAKIYQEISLVRESARKLSLNNVYQNTIIVDLPAGIDEYNAKVGGALSSGHTYYYLGFGDENVSEAVKQSLNDVLSLRDVEHSYIVEFLDEGNVEIYLVDGIRNGSNYVYSYEEISSLYRSVTKK